MHPVKRSLNKGASSQQSEFVPSLRQLLLQNKSCMLGLLLPTDTKTEFFFMILVTETDANVAFCKSEIKGWR